jgi:hypothetical protein
MDDVNEAQFEPAPVDKLPRLAESAPQEAKKRSVAQLALDNATGDCEAFARLSERLERFRVAFEGRGAAQPEAPARAGKSDPRPTSHLEGLAYIHGCNAEIIRRMELIVGRLETLLDCGSTP